MNSLSLASAAYAHAEQHYGDKDARFDMIVECLSVTDIAEHLEAEGIQTEAGAIGWAQRYAGMQHEQELNQAWDGPESVKSSSRYDPAYDPAGPPEPSEEDMRPAPWEREPYIDSYTGWPTYTCDSEGRPL